MTIRKQVLDFASMGPLPASDVADEADLMSRESTLRTIERPVLPEEALVLIELFGPDECYGLAWMLLHTIESCPALPTPSPELLARSEWLRSVWRGGL